MFRPGQDVSLPSESVFFPLASFKIYFPLARTHAKWLVPDARFHVMMDRHAAGAAGAASAAGAAGAPQQPDWSTSYYSAKVTAPLTAEGRLGVEYDASGLKATLPLKIRLPGEQGFFPTCIAVSNAATHSAGASKSICIHSCSR